MQMTAEQIPMIIAVGALALGLAFILWALRTSITRRIQFSSDAASRLWASTFEEGTFYSDDLGLTWQDGGLYGAYGFDFVFVPSRR
jgi:hypothetical protein